MRKQIIRSWTMATSVSELELHFFPYDTLPIIHSHIRSHCAVNNLGMKLFAFKWRHILFFDDQYKPLTSQHPTFFTCVQRSMYLYKEWTCKLIPILLHPALVSFKVSGLSDYLITPNAEGVYDSSSLGYTIEWNVHLEGRVRCRVASMYEHEYKVNRH